MAGAEVFHGLGDGTLDIHQTAVAQHHDKEAQPATRLSDLDRAEGAPIPLGTLTGGKGEGEKGGLTPGPDGAHVGFDKRIPAS